MAEDEKQNEKVRTEIYGGLRLRNYHGFWYPEKILPTIATIQHQFKPRPTDILLMTSPKSGTTWLKALSFSTITRNRHYPTDPNHPVLSTHPQDLVPFIDIMFASGRASELEALPSPRLLGSHLPYQLLPESVKNSDCKIVHICREPKDTLVSGWHFLQQNKVARFGLDKNMEDGEMSIFPLSEAFELFCRGIVPFGPKWDHMLGYWNESLKRPLKVLSLKYEDMKRDGVGNVKRLAEFLGCPFTEEEERGGVAGEIVRLCSFEKLNGLRVNKIGDRDRNFITIKNSSYFRKGNVGDWKDHLTTEMARRLDEITEEKLRGSGLSFQTAAD